MAATTKRLSHSIDYNVWCAVLDACRVTPENWTRIGAASGTTPRTVKRLWKEGYPRYAWGARPMRDVILDERRAADAKARAAEAASRGPDEREVNEGRRLAIETRAEEARHLRFARANVQALLNMTTQLSASGLRLAQRVDQTLAAEEAKSAEDKMTLAGALLTLTRIANIVQKGIYAAESCAGLERMVLGDPKERAGFEGDERDMTTDEALEVIGRAADLAKRVEQSGFRVFKGGRGNGIAIPLAPAEPLEPAAPPEENGEEDGKPDGGPP